MAAMKILILLLALSAASNAYNPRSKRPTKSDDSEVVCGYKEGDTREYRRVLYDFDVKTFKAVAYHSGSHFVFSPNSLWQTLAALAEGTDGSTRQELALVLGLPDDECERQSYYSIAATREPAGPDVILARSRFFFIDEAVTVDSQWETFALRQCNLITTRAPIKRDPRAAALKIRHVISSQLASLNLQGNSVLAESLDYHGLWSEAFSEAAIVRSPFYNHNGDQIGSVDMMRMKKRVRATFLEDLNCKVFEIPVGHNGRFRMLFGIPLKGHDMKKSVEIMNNSVIFDIVDNLKESLIPIEVGVPRFMTSSEVDFRRVMEDLGVHSLWDDALATRNISQPPASPSSFIQRVQIILDSHGLAPPTPDYSEYTSSDTGLDDRIGKELILDRPFMYGLFDVETYSCLFCAAYSVPTYT